MDDRDPALEPPFHSADVQLTGPYRLWRHTHRFEAFGIAGRAVHALKVRHGLEQVFDYRSQRIGELFAGRKLAEAQRRA